VAGRSFPPGPGSVPCNVARRMIHCAPRGEAGALPCPYHTIPYLQLSASTAPWPWTATELRGNDEARHTTPVPLRIHTRSQPKPFPFSRTVASPAWQCSVSLLARALLLLHRPHHSCRQECRKGLTPEATPIIEYMPRPEITSPVPSRPPYHPPLGRGGGLAAPRRPPPPPGARLAFPFLPLGSPRIFLAWRETGGDATFATLRCRGRGLPASADEMLAATKHTNSKEKGGGWDGDCS
jgi:hypothetical protein